MIKVENLYGGYDGFHLRGIEFSVGKGEFFGIIGPNGSGKTTLVKMMSGILQSERGAVFLRGRRVEDYRPKQLAKILAVLPQLTEQSFRFTVRETVALGRYAHQTGLFTTLTKYDEAIIDEVMAYTHITNYAHVTIDELSGGERQRVFLAQALAQEPEVIILDEPTNHLDLAYQKELLDLLNAWTIDRNLTVIAIFHDLNLASLYCDRLLLLNEGKVHICDLPNEVIQNKHIVTVYDTVVENHAHPSIPKLQVMLTPKQLNRDKRKIITEKWLKFSDDTIVYESPLPLKALSTNPYGAGNGWFSLFVNQYVANPSGNHADMIRKTKQLLQKNGYERNDHVIMLTSTNLQHRAVKQVVTDEFTFLVVVTADTTHAVDSSLGIKHSYNDPSEVGTVNTWIFIEGELLDYVFTQVIVTATEAKVRALQELNVLDTLTNTTATGNSTDNILVAATQSERILRSATTTSLLGSHIAEAVFTCTIEALHTHK